MVPGCFDEQSVAGHLGDRYVQTVTVGLGHDDVLVVESNAMAVATPAAAVSCSRASCRRAETCRAEGALAAQHADLPKDALGRRQIRCAHVLTGVTADMHVARKEIFRPVMVVLQFPTERRELPDALSAGGCYATTTVRVLVNSRTPSAESSRP